MASGETFAAVFDRHFDAVSAFLRRRVDADVADELTSEAFLIAFRSRGHFDTTRDSARPWLLGIATNLIRRDRRSQGRRRRAYGRLDRDQQPDFAEEAVTRSDASNRREQLVDALSQLSEDEADALLLLAWAELSYAEIAEALEIPIGTVRSRIARARRRMQELIAPGGQEREVRARG